MRKRQKLWMFLSKKERNDLTREVQEDKVKLSFSIPDILSYFPLFSVFLFFLCETLYLPAVIVRDGTNWLNTLKTKQRSSLKVLKETLTTIFGKTACIRVQFYLI